jgi:hypothetical protein
LPWERPRLSRFVVTLDADSGESAVLVDAEFDQLVESAPINSDHTHVDWDGIADVLELLEIDSSDILVISWCGFSEVNFDLNFSTPTLAIIHSQGILSSAGKNKMLGGGPKFDEVLFESCRSYGPGEYRSPQGDVGSYGITFMGPGEVVIGGLRWNWRAKRFRDSRPEIMAAAAERDRIYEVIDAVLSGSSTSTGPSAPTEAPPILGSQPNRGLNTVDSPSIVQITAFLKFHNLKYTVDSDDRVRFGYGAKEARPPVSFMFGFTDSKSRCFWFYGFAEHDFTREDKPRLLEICNAWNCHQRWPMAYVFAANDDPDKCEVRLSFAVPSANDFGQASVESFVATMHRDSMKFWDRLFETIRV